jgi:hypothetical protein
MNVHPSRAAGIVARYWYDAAAHRNVSSRFAGRVGRLADGFDDTGALADHKGPGYLLCFNVGESDWCQVINPRRRWRREADFTGWLAGNLDQLASCLGLQRLRTVGGIERRSACRCRM